MAISVVQHASGSATFSSGATGTATATFGSNITPGNCVVAIIGVEGGFGNFTLTSVTTNGAADNWSQALVDGDTITFFYVNPNSVGGQTVVDVNFSLTGLSTSVTMGVLIDLYEVSGVLTTSVVDSSTTTHDIDSTSSTSWTSGTSAVTNHANEIWFGAVST